MSMLGFSICVYRSCRLANVIKPFFIKRSSYLLGLQIPEKAQKCLFFFRRAVSYACFVRMMIDPHTDMMPHLRSTQTGELRCSKGTHPKFQRQKTRSFARLIGDLEASPESLPESLPGGVLCISTLWDGYCWYSYATAIEIWLNSTYPWFS